MADWLPDNWQVGIATRKDGTTNECYVNKETGQTFHTKEALLRYVNYLRNKGPDVPNMDRKQQTTSIRRCKASEASQATGRKAKRARGRPALPREQPLPVEQADEGQLEEEEVKEHVEEGQPNEEAHLATLSSGVGISDGENVSPDAGAGEVNIGGSGSDGLKLAAIAQEVDKVFIEGLSLFNMREALQNISSILWPRIGGEPTTPDIKKHFMDDDQTIFVERPWEKDSTHKMHNYSHGRVGKCKDMTPGSCRGGLTEADMRPKTLIGKKPEINFAAATGVEMRET